MAKFEPYKITKEIDGVEYTAQFVGCSVALRATDECKDKNGDVSNLKLSQFLLDNVITNPSGLTVDDFEDVEKLGNVTGFAGEVMSGKLKPEPVKEKKTTSK